MNQYSGTHTTGTCNHCSSVL